METFNSDTQTLEYPVTQQDAENAVRVLLTWIGEDIGREGLIDTPARVARAFREMAGGKMAADPSLILKRTFSSEGCDQMIWVKGVRFTSLCEHHLLPFVGQATLAYIPSGSVVGLSKIPRLIVELARRPQIQERLTTQIATTFDNALKPLGVGVIVTAKHHCMGCRGAKQPDAEMITSSLLGVFRQPEVRAEFYQHTSGGHR